MPRARPQPVDYLPVTAAHMLNLTTFLRPKVGGFYVVGFDVVSTTYKVWEHVRSLRAAYKSLAQLQLGIPPWLFPQAGFIIFYTKQTLQPWFYVYLGGANPI